MLTWRETQGEQPLAVICPAFPAQGRGLAAGALRFAQSPGQGLHLPTILGAQTALPLVAIGLERVRAGVEALADQLQQAVRQGANLVVVDGLADADLATLLAATGLATPGALLCGSAGLIEPLARRLAATGDYPPPLPAEPLRPPLLAVVGSGSEMSHRQLAALRAEGQIPLVELGDWAAEQSLLRQQQGALDGLVLHLPPPLPEAALEGEAARRLAVALARTATQVCADLQPGGLLVVGGDTAIHLLNELGIAQLTVVRELMPGIPLLTGVDRRGRRRQLITKAGNFGEETTLVRLFQKVQWKSTSEAGGR
jgi:D-threonate/D-erythronate kinase